MRERCVFTLPSPGKTDISPTLRTASRSVFRVITVSRAVSVRRSLYTDIEEPVTVGPT